MLSTRARLMLCSKEERRRRRCSSCILLCREVSKYRQCDTHASERTSFGILEGELGLGDEFAEEDTDVCGLTKARL
jgi:hypothetical protein